MFLPKAHCVYSKKVEAQFCLVRLRNSFLSLNPYLEPGQHESSNTHIQPPPSQPVLCIGQDHVPTVGCQFLKSGIPQHHCGHCRIFLGMNGHALCPCTTDPGYSEPSNAASKWGLAHHSLTGSSPNAKQSNGRLGPKSHITSMGPPKTFLGRALHLLPLLQLALPLSGPQC
jgi:hypothetical protein